MPTEPFDPFASGAAVMTAPEFDPFTSGEAEQRGPDWATVFASKDGLLKLSGGDRAAYGVLAENTDGSKEDKAQAVNMAYLHSKLPEIALADLEANWPAAKLAYAQTALGWTDGDISDSVLSEQIAAREEMTVKERWVRSGPIERLKMMFGAHGYGDTEVVGATPAIGSEAAGTKGGLFTIPKAEGDEALAGLMNASNKMVAGLTTPENVGIAAVTGGAGVIAKLASAVRTIVAARVTQAAALGTFAVIGVKDSAEAIREAKLTVENPEATDADKADAIATAVLSSGMTALAAKGTYDFAIKAKAAPKGDAAEPAKPADAAAETPAQAAEPTKMAAAKPETLGPERVEGAASRTADGRILRGEDHGRIQDTVPGETLEHGFVTSAGRFVSREEAFQLARQAGQVKSLRRGSIPDDQYHASDLEFSRKLEEAEASGDLARIAAARKIRESQGVAQPAETLGRDAGALADGPDTPPPATPPAPKTVAEKGDPISIKNANVDAELAAMGEPPATHGEKLTFDGVRSEVADVVTADPHAGGRLVAQLRENPRPISAKEDVLLTFEINRRRLARDAAEQELIDAVRNGDRDGEVTAQFNIAKARSDFAEIADVATQAGTSNAQALAFRRMMMKEDYSLAAMERRAVAANNGKALAAEDATELKAIYDRLKKAEQTLAEYRARQTAGAGTTAAPQRSSGASARPPAKAAKPVRSFLAKQATEARARITARMKSGRVQSGLDPADLADHAIIGAELMARGVGKFADWSTAMAKEFGETIRPHLADIFERAASTYDSTRLNVLLEQRKARLEKAVAELKKKVDAGDISTKPTKANRPAIEAIERLEQQRNTLRSALTGLREQAAKVKELEASIAEKTRKIEAGDLSAKGVPVNRPAVNAIETLKLQRDALNAELTAARKEAAKPDVAEKLQRNLEAIQKQIETRKAALESGNLGAKPQSASRPMVRELEEAKQELERVNAEIAAARKGPEIPAEEKALAAFKTRKASRIAELEEKLANEDITAKERRVIHLDEEANRLQAALEMVQLQYDNMVERVRYENSSAVAKVRENALNLYDAGRMLMTTGEFSFVLRQGKVGVLSHPILAAKAIPNTFRAFMADPAGAHAINLQVLNHFDAPAAKRAKLFLAEEGAALTRQEELLMGKLIGQVPLLTKTIGRFNQAATVFLNRLRFDVWNQMRKSSGGLDALGEKQLAMFVNEATGRGGLGSLEQAAVPLGRLMFSPRYFASRLQLVAGHSLWGGTWASRRVIAKEYAKTLIGLGLYYSMLLMAFDDDDEDAIVGTDPRSSDFGKVKIGNTRLDPLAGVSQVITFAARTAFGETTTTKGKTKPIRGEVPFGGDKWSDVAARFARSKLHPIPASIVNLFDGTDLGGNKADVANQALNLSAPITYADVYQALEEHDLPDGVALGLLAMLGEGLQTYETHKRQANFTSTQQRP